MENCIFCNIAKGEMDADIVYQDDQVLAFNDVNPQAPHHVLIIPHVHIATTNDLNPEHNELIGHMVHTAKELAQKLEIAESGYRMLLNCNSGGGQAVYHIHLHLLGGRQMTWPPG